MCGNVRCLSNRVEDDTRPFQVECEPSVNPRHVLPIRVQRFLDLIETSFKFFVHVLTRTKNQEEQQPAALCQHQSSLKQLGWIL